MNFDRIVRTDIAADESGVLATMRFDEEAIRDMAGKIDAELFDRIATERGYLRQRVDVAALLRIAARLDESASYGSWQAETAGRIREAVEGATVPDAESDAERACAALMGWRDQVAGLLGIDVGSMADEVQDAIMDELDKRLMPPGCEWPRFEDGEKVLEGDSFLYVAHGNTPNVKRFELNAVFDSPGGEWIYKFKNGERIKRPEPEVLGADGLPIRVGETVWYHDTCNANEFVVVGITPPGGYQSVRITLAGSPSGDSTWVDAPRLTHTPPNIQARIDKNAKMHPLAYCRYVLKWDGEDVKRTDDVDCGRAMIADLLRRQRELDAKTMGGAR